MNSLVLRRGPYVIVSGLDDLAQVGARELRGHFINLFDAGLPVQKHIFIEPGMCWFLLDLTVALTGKTHLLASACKENFLNFPPPPYNYPQ